MDFEEIILKKHGEFIIYQQRDGFNLGYAIQVTFDAIINPSSDIEEIIFVCSEDTERINEEYRKDLLVTMMRHKFNTLDTITQVNLDALAFLIKSPDPAMESKIISGLKESSNRMTNIVRSVLDFLNLPNKIDPDKIELITALYLKNIISDIMSGLNQKDTLVEIRYSDNASFEMVKGGLYLILYELIENSIKFGNQKDLGLIVSVESVQDQELQISVFNHGNRINSEKINRIWDRFYQLDPHSTGQIEGIGLGLSTVKYIVDLSGGTSRVYSNELGTTFILTFPTHKVNYHAHKL